jgi:radical SAM protein with 4Fe4S-binding SPASM domain
MINLTRLLRTDETEREVKRHQGKEAKDVPKHLIRYSKVSSPMVVWNITRKCNLSCSVCHLDSAATADEGELTTEEAMDFIDQMAEIGVPLISVYGGEPLTRKDFLELASHAHMKGLRMIFSTNANLVTGKMAEKIRDSGITYVGIDLDGFAQQNGGFDVLDGLNRAMPAIQHLKEAGLGCGVRITLGNFNSHKLQDIVRAIENSGLKRFAVCQLLDGRPWKEVRAERLEIMKFLTDYTMRSPSMEVITEHVYADGVYILERLKRKDPQRVRRISKLLALQGGCPAGRKLINVDHLGFVHPCMYWKEHNLGSIKKGGLADLWAKGNLFPEKLRNRIHHLRGKCSNCGYTALCGGCRSRAERYLGDCFRSDPACYLH